MFCGLRPDRLKRPLGRPQGPPGDVKVVPGQAPKGVRERRWTGADNGFLRSPWSNGFSVSPWQSRNFETFFGKEKRTPAGRSAGHSFGGSFMTRTHRSGFTLVEILIVVIILGILAAIVIPQFTEASSQAKLNSMTSDLQTVRSQIQLYKVQHNDNVPTAATFVAQMTTCTKVDGTAGTLNVDFGPYMQTIPNNPFTNTNTVGGTATAGASAWYWDGVSVFEANDTAAHQAY